MSLTQRLAKEPFSESLLVGNIKRHSSRVGMFLGSAWRKPLVFPVYGRKSRKQKRPVTAIEDQELYLSQMVGRIGIEPITL
ncbi:MAG: hypothetical protein JRD47_02695 [Deltaproteobacteria bacterium]|nr:hypothetical protein [Deltaproteobacteria bacterium]